MKIRDVIIIGDGIAGYAAALTLAKQGIAVTLVTSSVNKCIHPFALISKEGLEEMLGQFHEKIDDSLSCSRAYEHLASFGRSSMQLLFDADLSTNQKKMPLYHYLREQLQAFDQVEWLTHHHLVELLTLDQHSVKPSDRYKKATCLGVVVYDREKQEMITLFSKETILATGGFPSFFSYSMDSYFGMEWVIAQRAGARLLNIDQIPFCSLVLLQNFPLPLALLKEGGKLYQEKGVPLDLDSTSQSFIQDFYDALVKRGTAHAWLDLSSLDLAFIKEKFPFFEEYCANTGLNFSKDLLPIGLGVSSFQGGLAVDRGGQTSLHRLRAIGEMACTGLSWKQGEEAFSVLESLTWAVTCAEEIAKQMNRLVYYFPEIKKPLWSLRSDCLDRKQLSPIEEDRQLLYRIIWLYLGMRRDRERLERGKGLLEQLRRFNAPRLQAPLSIEQMQLFYTIQAAELIVQAALVNFENESRDGQFVDNR